MPQRTVILILSLISLAVGLTMFLAYGWDAAITRFEIGLFIRLGLVLGTIWLALPTIQTRKGKLPKPLLIVALVVLAVIVVRPRILPIAIGLLVIIGVVHYGLRWLARNVTRRSA